MDTIIDLWPYFLMVGLLFVAFVLIPMSFRVVVLTNESHIVQTGKSTISYGKDTENGNTYYRWPTWVPIFGVQRTVMPVSVFDIDLEDYEVYDLGRLPFRTDVKAFFRITDSNVAAQRVSDFKELKCQLKAIVEGAVRSVIASFPIEEIMQGRGTFGDQFTKEVNEELSKNWGVSTIRNIELMDIRDTDGGKVILNIMSKKKSEIEMQSRVEIAANSQKANIAEIDAKRQIELQQQEAAQLVGIRTVEARQRVELAEQTKDQTVKEQQKITKEKEMAVKSVEQVRAAEILKETTLLKAEQDRQAMVIQSEGELESERRKAEATRLNGAARADSERALLLAPVEAQTALAKEIGNNEGYQKYLIQVEQIKAAQTVGMEQAKALQAADIKIIANSGDVNNGMTKLTDIFSSQGGQNIGALLEGLKNTPVGKTLLEKALPN